MSEQEKIEQALKDIHVLFSKCDYYNDDKNMIIVDKRELFRLLERINLYMYEMMDEYEVTQQSKARGERKAKEKGDAIIMEANQTAEDVYAAAMLYTDEALEKLRRQMSFAMDEIAGIYEKLQEEIKQENKLIDDNRIELRGQLEDMKEQEKYLQILHEVNQKRIEEEREEEADGDGPRSRRPMRGRAHRPEPVRFEEGIKIVAPTPEIKINPAYEENAVMDSFTEGAAVGGSQINVNLDAEYFKWKNGDLPEVEEGIIEDFEEGVVGDTPEVETPSVEKSPAGKLMGALFGKK